MKNLSIILTFLIFASCSPYKIVGVPKNSSVIIVQNDLTAKENLLFVKKTLAENGIEISSEDKDVLQIKTGLMPIDKLGYSAFYIIYCKDKSIRINGLFNTGDKNIIGVIINDDPFRKIYYQQWGGEAISFRSMNEFAKTLGNDIKYQQ